MQRGMHECIPMSTSRHPSSFLSRLIAALLALHILLVTGMAASAALHHLVHHDSEAVDHDCAVTLFTHGASDDVPMPLVVKPEWYLSLGEELGEPVWLAPLRWYTGILEHAPPRSA